MPVSASLSRRRLYLVVGVAAMLFSGVLYAWSILKMPFKELFAWSDSALAFNFTLTMCFFCLGAFFGSLICKRTSPRFALILAGILVGIGFCLTGLLTADGLFLLYITYAVLAASGIGISYNVIVSTVTAWFPDKKGFCSGCLMMGFGFSTLLLGNMIDALFESSVGWSGTYLLLGILLAVVLVIAGLILRRPAADTVFPAAKAGKNVRTENFEVRDFTTTEMLRSFTYWRAFVCLAFITAVGNSVISFARDLMLSVDAAPALATTLVGVLSVCNGLGRILTGALYDSLGRRKTMLAANGITIIAAGITLLAVGTHSLPLCILGLCLTGLSYGSCPTVTSAFTSSFYGTKYFPVNYSITNFNLVAAAFIAAGSNSLLISTGSYTAPFIMLLILAVCALGLNFSVRKP
ncbi:MAG: OFA family MFS transporter [Ruminococcaceae bacterium]|nr:OFA family MFS transporter [Oscillospiraceae bacterium]